VRAGGAERNWCELGWPSVGGSSFGPSANGLRAQGSVVSSPAEGGTPGPGNRLCRAAIKEAAAQAVLQLAAMAAHRGADSWWDRATRAGLASRRGGAPSGIVQAGSRAIRQSKMPGSGGEWTAAAVEGDVLVLFVFSRGADPRLPALMRSCPAAQAAVGWRVGAAALRTGPLSGRESLFRRLRFRRWIQVEGKEGLDLRVGEAAAPLLGLRLQRNPLFGLVFPGEGQISGTRWARFKALQAATAPGSGPRLQAPGQVKCKSVRAGGPTDRDPVGRARLARRGSGLKIGPADAVAADQGIAGVAPVLLKEGIRSRGDQSWRMGQAGQSALVKPRERTRALCLLVRHRQR